jgi:hypothetical protein
MDPIDLSAIRQLRARALPCYRKIHAYPQDAYVCLQEDGTVTAEASSAPRPGLRWKIDPALRGEQIADAVERLAPLLEEVHRGHTVEWDGGKRVERLTDEASVAADQLERELEALESDVEVWDVERVKDGLWRNHYEMLDVWQEGRTLESVVQDAMPKNPRIYVDGDLEDLKKAIVEDAMDLIHKDTPGLTPSHLDALVAEGALHRTDAEEYAEEHIGRRERLLSVWPEGHRLDAANTGALEDSIYLLEHDLPGLTRWHLDALVAEGELDPIEADGYAEEHIGRRERRAV